MKSVKFLLPLLLCVSCSKQEEKKPDSKMNEITANSVFKCVDTAANGLFDDCNYIVNDINTDYLTANIKFLPNQKTEISSIKISDSIKKIFIDNVNQDKTLTQSEKVEAKKSIEVISTLIQSIVEKYKLTLTGNKAKHEFIVNKNIIDTLKQLKSEAQKILKAFPIYSQEYREGLKKLNAFDQFITKVEQTNSIDIADFLKIMSDENNEEISQIISEIENSNISIEKDASGDINIKYNENNIISTKKFTFKLEKGERVYKLN